MASPEFVTLRAPARGLTLTLRLGEGSPQVTGGIGGWEAVARPQRRALTVWRGPSEPLKMTLPVLFDGWGETKTWDGRSVERDIRTLERMGGLDKGDPEPPLLLVEGALPHDESRSPANRWVIDTIEWGDALRREDGHRVRQPATVTLIEHVEDVALERLKPRNTLPRFRHYRVRKGDTFEKIAARELGTRRLGRRLARLNDGRSPDKVLQTNRRIRLPAGELLEDWRKDLKKKRR